MAKILKVLLIISIFSVVFGPVMAVTLFNHEVKIYLSDLFIGQIGIIWLIRIKKFPKYFLLFVGVSLLSLIFSPLTLSLSEKVTSALYWLRFVCYFSLFPASVYLIKAKVISKEKIVSLLVISGFLLALFGWMQYFLYPDLRNLYYLGWDPHYKRIFGTLLDPNYLGLFLVMTFIFSLGKKSTPIIWLLRGFLLLTILFTYSRSSFLALIVALFGYALMKRRFAVLSLVVLLFLSFIPLLPRPPGESVRLERMFSVTERLNNWKGGLKIFMRYPFLGVGFNTVRFAKAEFGIEQDNLRESHSGAGFDNSFIFVAATSGIMGVLSYLILLGSIYKRMELTGKVIFWAVVTHSMFVNSLFLPSVMIWWWIIVGVKV